MNRPAASSIALLATLAGLALAAPEGDFLVGKWKVKDTAGKATGNLKIERAPKGDHRFVLEWNVDTGGYHGVGLLRQGHLYTAWGRGANGVMIFSREGDTWTSDWVGVNHAEEALGHETITGVELTGEHSITGRAPNGNEYTGKVVIRPTGDTLQLEWTVGDGTYVGIGLRCGEDKLVVAYGQGNFGVMDYDVSGANASEGFDGRWSNHGADRIALERLERAKRQ